MKRNEYLFAAILTVSAVMVVYGVAQVGVAAAWIVSGFLTAGLGWLTLSDSK